MPNSLARAHDLSTIAPPEPGLTPEALIARAVALRPLLRSRQAECEALGKVPDDVNAELVRAGFYRAVQPRRFGGYEFDIPNFYRAMMEIARGCSDTGWVVSLTAGHPFMAAFFSEEGQRDVYGDAGEFRCPAGFNPPGTAVAVDGGYRVTGSWVSASGIDHATHFVTQAGVVDASGATVGSLLMMLRRDEFEILDDWRVMGMQGTGSKSVVAKNQFVPACRATKTRGVGLITAVALPGPRIHANPVYYGRIGAFLAGEGASVAVGAARGALDLYEDVLSNRRPTQRPTLDRSKDPEFLHYYGEALANVSAAEAALIRQGQEYMEYTAEEARGGAAFDTAREHRLILIAQRSIDMAWQAIDLIFRTAGTSASVKQGQPIGRIFRNIATIRTHPLHQADRTALAAAQERFGA
jgi:3-hydroxy-9,10-secoandrosta-1,3,5(10)-triene-9,17-dione monooxygenase